MIITLLAALVVALGCQQDEITQYKVPKAEFVKHEAPKTAKGTERMLAAMLPRSDRAWFLKFQGPEQDVAAHKAEFDQVLKSIRFDVKGKEPITWTTPQGWKREPGNDMRFATLKFDSKEKPLEMTITVLEGKPDVLANVKRWRKQLGLPEVSENDLPNVTTQLKVEDVTATVVDITGTSGGKMPPFAGRFKAPAAPRQNEDAAAAVKYDTPAAWKVLPPSGFRLAGFEVTEGKQHAEITIIPLGARSGSLLENVIRWREQIGLPPIGEEELRRDLHEVEVAGQRCPYVELLGPESAGAKRQRMLGVVVARDDSTWYFKMTGSPDLVSKQKATFESFLRSVRFDGGQ